MKDILKKGAVIAAAMLASASLFAGPFGIEAGWTEDELTGNGNTVVEKMAYDSYRLGAEVVPAVPHRSFNRYFTVIDKDYGVYEIAAMKSEEDILADDLDLITEYELVKDQLTRVYGEPLALEYLDEKTDGSKMGEFPPELWRLEREVVSYWFLPAADPFSLVILKADMDPRTEEGLQLTYWAKTAETVAERAERSDVEAL